MANVTLKWSICPDLYMQSHFGGTLDYMFNDKFGITGGLSMNLIQ